MKLLWRDVLTVNDTVETECANMLAVISVLKDRHDSASHMEEGGDVRSRDVTRVQETSFSVRLMVAGNDASFQAVRNQLLAAPVFVLPTVGGDDVRSTVAISPLNRLLSIA